MLLWGSADVPKLPGEGLVESDEMGERRREVIRLLDQFGSNGFEGVFV